MNSQYPSSQINIQNYLEDSEEEQQQQQYELQVNYNRQRSNSQRRDIDQNYSHNEQNNNNVRKPRHGINKIPNSNKKKKNQQQQNDKENNKIQQYENQKKLKSLMSGNDLQPLEEEVSKEEDDSLIIRVDMLTGIQSQDQQQFLKNQAQAYAILQSASHSSVGSECNYNKFMEEAQTQYDMLLLERNKRISESSSAPKMFDTQFQQSQSCERSNNNTFSQNNCSINTHRDSNPPLKVQLVQDVINQKQKEKAKNILEELKQLSSSPMNQNDKSRCSNSNLTIVNFQQMPVEQRLFDYQKKLDEKIDQQRKEKEIQELQQLRQAPQISQRSNDIISKKIIIKDSNLSPFSQNTSPKELNNDLTNIKSPLQQQHYGGFNIDQTKYYEEKLKKENMRLKLQEEQEMKDYTGKPEINKKSKSIKRNVDDLLYWKEKQDRKMEDELKKKNESEKKEIENIRSHRVINKKSEKMIEYKLKQRQQEKVEDRLIRDASARQKRIVENSNHKDKNQQRLRSKSQNPNCNEIKNLQQKQSRNKSPVIKSQKNQDQSPKLMNSQKTNFMFSNNTFNTLSNSYDFPLQQSQQFQSGISQFQFSNHNQQPLFSQTNQSQPQLSQQSQIQNQQTQQQNQIWPLSPFSKNEDTRGSFINQTYSSNDPNFFQNNITYSSQSQQNGKSQIQQDFNNNMINPSSLNQNGYNNQNHQMSVFQQNIQSPINYQNQTNNSRYIQEFQPLQNQYSQDQKMNLNHQQQYPRQQQNQSKKKTVVYESLFTKVQKMNVSNSQNNCDSDSLQSQQFAVVSASIPNLNSLMIFNNNNNNQNNSNQQQQQFNNNMRNNPVYQSIQLDSINNHMINTNFNNYKSINLNDQNHNSNYSYQHKIGQVTPYEINFQNISNNNNNDMNNDLYQYLQNKQNHSSNNSTPYSNHTINNQKQINDFNQSLQSQKQTTTTSMMQQHLHQIQQNQNNNNSNNVNNQDFIIKKILENSHIPTGNAKEIRKSGRLSNGFDIEQNQQINQNNVAQILDTDCFNKSLDSQNSEKVIKTFKILNSQTLSNIQNKQQQNTRPQSKQNINDNDDDEKVIEVNNLNYNKQKNDQKTNSRFYDRNSKWVEDKKQKLEKVKEILDQREGRQCPFKPATNQIINYAIKSQRNKSGGSKLSQKNYSTEKTSFKNTREQEIQANIEHEQQQHETNNNNNNQILTMKQQHQYSSSQVQFIVQKKMPHQQQQQVNCAEEHSSSHTTNKIHEAIEMMNFTNGVEEICDSSNNIINCNQQMYQLSLSNNGTINNNNDYNKNEQFPNDLSEQCDISCLSPQANDKNQINNEQIDESSNFDSVSFLSVGGNENDIFTKKPMNFGFKTFVKKQIKF